MSEPTPRWNSGPVVEVIRETLVATGESVAREAHGIAAPISRLNAEGAAAAQALRARTEGLRAGVQPNAPLPALLVREGRSWREVEEAMLVQIKGSLDLHAEAVRTARVALMVVSLETTEARSVTGSLEGEIERFQASEEEVHGMIGDAAELLQRLGTVRQGLIAARAEVSR